jgi:hypothetical protein
MIALLLNIKLWIPRYGFTRIPRIWMFSILKARNKTRLLGCPTSAYVSPCHPKIPILAFFQWPYFQFSFSIMQCPMLTCTPGFKRIHPCFQNAPNTNLLRFGYCKICVPEVLKHVKNKQKSYEFFLISGGIFLYPIFILYYDIPYTNKRCQTSSIWHVVAQYENNRT